MNGIKEKNVKVISNVILIVLLSIVLIFILSYVNDNYFDGDLSEEEKEFKSALESGDIERALKINKEYYISGDGELKELAYEKCDEKALLELYPRDFINAYVTTLYEYEGDIHEYEILFENTSNFDIEIKSISIIKDAYTSAGKNDPERQNCEFIISAGEEELFTVLFGDGYKNDNTKETTHLKYSRGKTNEDYTCYYSIEVL